MSTYTSLLKIFESYKCKNCGGLGYVDDAEPGDIGFNTWECEKCNGSGVKDNIELKITGRPHYAEG